MEQDEIIKEVRALREAYAERFGFDVQALYQDAKRREQAAGRRTVAFEPRPAELAATSRGGADSGPGQSPGREGS